MIYCSAPTDNIYPFQVLEDDRLREGLARSGFTCSGITCTPCHFGEYQKRLKNGSYICEKCPAGNMRKSKRTIKSYVDMNSAGFPECSAAFRCQLSTSTYLVFDNFFSFKTLWWLLSQLGTQHSRTLMLLYCKNVPSKFV